MKRRRLTTAQHERIAALRIKRWTVESIAADVGCSVGSVSWSLLINGVDIHPTRPLPPVPQESVIAIRAGHVVRRFTQTDDEQLLALEATGLNLHKIALAMGRKRNAIIGRLATLARREARQEALEQAA